MQSDWSKSQYNYSCDESSLETPLTSKNKESLNVGYSDEDSGYKGSDNSPKNIRRKFLRKAKLHFTPEKEILGVSVKDIQAQLVQLVPLIITIIFVSSIFFMVFMGGSNRTNNGK